jgi:hypothetical protein
MTFTPEQLAQIEEREVVWRTLRLFPARVLGGWLPALSSTRAREYLTHGVCRRILVIGRCFENVFEICPPDQVDLLSIAWVTVLEKTPNQLPKPQTVSLFRSPARDLLSPEARAYLYDSRIRSWRVKYARDCRDVSSFRDGSLQC